MSWVKIIHILCVMGWMTSIFAVPRAIIYWKREHARLGENGPLGDLTYRLYRFSFGLGVIAILTGVWYGIWLGWPAWLHLKATLVVLLAAHYHEYRDETALAQGFMPFGVSSLIARYQPMRIGFAS